MKGYRTKPGDKNAANVVFFVFVASENYVPFCLRVASGAAVTTPRIFIG